MITKTWTRIKKIWTGIPVWGKIGIGLGSMLIIGLLIKGNSKKARQQHWVNRVDAILGPLNYIQRESVAAIVAAFEEYGDGDENKLIYMLATAEHESSFEPKREYRANPSSQPSLYATQQKYWPSGYYGRGLVQITWESNYRELSPYIGVDLVKNPDLALNVKIAAKILVVGMMDGLFGHPLHRHINENVVDFYNARRTVNGTDKAARIEGIALSLSGGA